MIESLYIIPDAPRLALLSDLHGRPYRHAVFSLQRNKPDIICITGDIIYGIWPADDISPLVSQPYVLPFLERCAGIAPTYLSLGNHEQALDQKDLETIVNTGVTVLDNCWVQRNGVVIDYTCRNHGGCPYCEQNRRHKFRDKHPVEKDEMIIWIADGRKDPSFLLLKNIYSTKNR